MPIPRMTTVRIGAETSRKRWANTAWKRLETTAWRSWLCLWLSSSVRRKVATRSGPLEAFGAQGNGEGDVKPMGR